VSGKSEADASGGARPSVVGRRFAKPRPRLLARPGSSWAKAPSVMTSAPMKSTDKSRSSCVLPQHSTEGPLPRAASMNTVWVGVVTLFPLLPTTLREARLCRASSVVVVRWVRIWLPTKGWAVDQSSPTGCRRPRTGATVGSFRAGWLRDSLSLCISSCFRNSVRSIQITSCCRGASNCNLQRWSPLASTSRSTIRPSTHSVPR